MTSSLQGCIYSRSWTLGALAGMKAARIGVIETAPAKMAWLSVSSTYERTSECRVSYVTCVHERMRGRERRRDARGLLAEG